MKKIVVLVVVVAVALVGANIAMATISQSKHDLSQGNTTQTIKLKGSVPSGSAISACQFCHTPHLGSYQAIDQAPLWNRSISAGGTGDYSATNGQFYKVYGASATQVQGVTLSGTTIDAPGSNSKTCLSCHDGVQSLGDVLVASGNNADRVFDDYATPRLSSEKRLTGGPAALSTDLTNEHPIGFSVIPGRAGIVSISNMKVDGARFYSGETRMECATCHDPHETGNAAKPKFLRMNYTSMCTDCHETK